MNYEKAYKAVLQTAKQWIKDGCTDKERICLECIFPELRESEDERVIKALEAFINRPEIAGKITFEARVEWLAWLEKQKEQKTDAKSERVIKAARRVLNDWLDGTDCPDVSGDFTELEYAIREYDGEEKQKEPHYTKRNALFDKCVENCDPKVMKEVSDEIDEMLGKERKLVEFEWPNLSNCIKNCKKCLGKCFYRKEPYEEQKSAEEQDYSGLNDLERAIHRGFLAAGVENVPVTIIKETAQECLAQMKPAEWSEEDKRKLNRIYEILGYAADDKGFLTSKRIIGDKEAIELQDFLKSLRPSWKPSEEQMEVDLGAEIEMKWDSFSKHIAEYGEESDEVVWLNRFSFVDIANYFYELGKNSK